MYCKICGFYSKNYHSLSLHIRRFHNITSREYYDMYERINNNGFCENCKKQTKFKQLGRGYNKFCGQSCSAIYFNLKRGKKKSPCQSCGSPIIKRNSTLFCSNKCFQIFRFTTRLNLWLNGEFKPDNRVIRKFLITLYGNKCSECGTLKWCGKDLILEVEHKNGNGDDTLPANVCLICPNCHSQTSTYKGKNFGKGRYKRRQRFLEGKSY